MNLFFREYVDKFFKSITKYVDNKKFLTQQNLEYIFEACLDFLEMPIPPNNLRPHFINSKVISLIYLGIFNDDRLSRTDRLRLEKYLNKVLPLLKYKASKNVVQYRILGREGYYPNMEIKRGNCHYLIQNSIPILVTISNDSSEYKYQNSSEITWINRNELKISTAVLLAYDGRTVNFYFNDYNTFSINFSILTSVPQKDRVYFLTELMHIHNRFEPLNKQFFRREPIADVTNYFYTEFKSFENVLNQLFDSFSIRNELLLRTSMHLIKAIMLWNNRNFGEEAVANVFFSLEGCLHLLQKKFGNNSRKLDLKFLKNIFTKTFDRGEYIFDFIREGYEKRIELVHPEPEWGTKLNPFIMADDFYEYFNLSRFLLNYILIERIIEE